MKRFILLAALIAVSTPGFVRAVEVSGDHENPNQDFGKDASYKLTGPTKFGWRTGTLAGDIDLNGHAFVIDTGGGNRTVFSGAITGKGSFEWNGGGVPQVAPSILNGDRPNSFQGTFTLSKGVLDLAKPAGVDAISGDLIIGTKGGAFVRLGQSDQINDAVHVTLGGTGISGLELQGHNEKFASLTLKTHGEILMGDQPAALQVGDSSARSWDLTKTLTVRGFKPGKDKLVFGKDDKGLTPEQLARIGFAAPEGMSEGLYTAKIGNDGQLAPRALVQAVYPPFDVSPQAIAERAKIYNVPGLANLSGPASPLRDGMTIDFFGDSITWQNGFIEAMGKALKTDEGTKGKSIKLVNRGINGGGVLQVRDGVTNSAYPGSSAQKPFAEVIAADRADLAVVFIGINDVWWRNTAPEVFEKTLRELVASAKSGKTKLVLATLTVRGELPDGKNSDDAKIDQYAALTRKVASDTGTTLVDLRKAYVAYLQNHNARLRVDGTLYFMPSGVLTYDGVHPSGQGVALLANQISDGIVRAFGGQKPERVVVSTAVPPVEKIPDAPAPVTPTGTVLPLVPLPKSVTLGKGVLNLRADSRIFVGNKELEPLAKVLAGEIQRATGVEISTEPRRPTVGIARPFGYRYPTDITLQIAGNLKGETYTLRAAEDGAPTHFRPNAAVMGGNYHSVAAGTATLLQLLRVTNGALTMPQLTISDEPAYPYRGALIDLGRKYHSPGGIEQVIELCRLYKIRYLHLHLSDDQLFMFPSAKFPQLGKSNREFARFEPPSKPKIASYTLDELRALEKFARERGVYLVPELDLPGHSGRMIADAQDIFGIPGNGSTVNIASPKTLDALTALMNEVMDVFQSTPYVHLGADEVGLGGLDKTADYQEAVAKFGVKSVHDLYCKFVSDMHAVVSKRGKKVIVWEEAFNPGGAFPLPKDALVMVWSQGRNPNDIVKSGYEVVNATWTPLYIVRDNKKSLEFLFDWSLPKFGREGSINYTTLADTAKLMGAQLCSWENSEAIEIQSMRDRLALVAERAWNPQAGGTFAGFKTRLAHTDAVLEKLVHSVTIQAVGKFVGDENTFTEPLTLTLTAQRPGLTLKYTLDNTLPNERWQRYAGPFLVEKTVHLRAGLFDDQGVQQGRLAGSWFRSRIAAKPNLATGKPVTVGPSPDRKDGWFAKIAVDGRADDAGGHWASEGPAPQWLQVDLERACPIDFINVITYWDGGRYYQWNAEVSVDGQTWKKVLDFSDNKTPATAQGYSGKFPKTEARYVRINMLKNSANPFVHIVELIVDETK